MVKKLPLPLGYRFYRPLIETVAAVHGLNPVLVAAVCWQESDFQTNAFRFEPEFWNRYLKANPKYRHLNPHRVSSSYGLMQVMFARVWEDKIADNDALPPEHLFVPELGLDTGCRLLAELLVWAKARTIPAAAVSEPNVHTLIALAAYNGGRGGNDPAKNWPLRNARYAREVLANYTLISKGT